MARKQNKRVAEQPAISAEDVSDDSLLLNELSDEEDQSEQRLFDPNDYDEPSREGEENSEEEEPSDEEAELEMLAALQAQREQETEQRPTIDNHEALIRLEGELSLKHLPWIELQTVTSSEPIVPDDVHDDLKRELAFYAQALEATEIGLNNLRKAGVPVNRPADYFAEMVKTDAHMEKIRRKLMDERTKLTASEDARRQRELKKFGKKVQQEKLLERQKTKSAELDKIKTLKKKRKGADLTDDHDEDFDVAIDKATSATSTKNHGTRSQVRNAKRQKKVSDYLMNTILYVLLLLIYS
ncbi:eukaryotic rRNA processing protein EBP2-domain-containing protein [Syncephalis plumigaleata]|nr:eukaryotic rRNA processing protein EBP2-domain-containing protein [Syncephalis plumigaleata]